MNAESIEHTTRSLADKGQNADLTQVWTAQVLAKRTIGVVADASA